MIMICIYIHSVYQVAKYVYTRVHNILNIRTLRRDPDNTCDDLLSKDAAYAKAISVVGLHYPSDFNNYDTCHKLEKPIWASEESSSYDDLNGAACWARVITSHYVLNDMTSSIMWNLVGSYYHGTNWYASSMLTAVQVRARELYCIMYSV